MKFFLLIPLLFCCLYSFAQNEKENPNNVASAAIRSSCQIIDIWEDGANSDEKPEYKLESSMKNTCNYLTYDQGNRFYNDFVKYLKARDSISIYDIYGNFFKPVLNLPQPNLIESNYEIINGLYIPTGNFNRRFSLGTEPLDTGAYDYVYTYYYQENKLYNSIKETPFDLLSLDFCENWQFDKEKGTFQKDILGLGLVGFNETYDPNTGEITGIRKYLFEKGHFTVPAFDKSSDEKKQDDSDSNINKYLFADSIVYDVLIRNSQNCEKSFEFAGADPYFYIEPSKRSKLITYILESLSKGKCRAYDYFQDEQIDFSKQLSFEEAIAKISYTPVEMSAYDDVALTKYKKQVLVPRIEYKYQLDENGEMEYLEENNWEPIIIDTIVQYDTVLKLDVGDVREMDKVNESEEEIYQLDEDGEIAYPEENNWEPIVLKTITQYDTVWKINEEALQKFDKECKVQLIDTIWSNTIQDVIGFRFYESWYFDPVKFSIQKEVKGIGMVLKGKWKNEEAFLSRYFMDIDFLSEKMKYEKFPGSYELKGIYIDLNN